MNGLSKHSNRFPHSAVSSFYATSDGYEIPRARMVERLRSHYRITDDRVLDAMNHVPRHFFVPDALHSQAYKDNALPISHGQTISQPFIVARMTELLELTGKERVLEIGAGSGYQTVILACLARQVFAIERLQELASAAKEKMLRLGVRNVTMKCGDGTAGWEFYQPFDAILVAAGGPEIPKPLLEQLNIGGRLVIPYGSERKKQILVQVKRTENGFQTIDCGPCSFVPLIGEHGWENDEQGSRSC